MYSVLLTPQCTYKRNEERGKYGDGKMGSENPGGRERMGITLCADDLVLCGELEENLRAVVGRFAEGYRRRSLKDNAGKSMVMMLNGEEGLECDIHIDGIHLEYVCELKYLRCFGRIRYRWGRV